VRLPFAPRDFLDGHHAAAAAVDTPHGVVEEDEKSPQGNKLEGPFGELIVADSPLVPARAHCDRTPARPYNHFNALLVGTETGALVDKTPKAVAAVQDRDQFNSAQAGNGETSTINRLRSWLAIGEG
jgi:hypothetical protein